jgi:hypothetical protein
MKSAGKADIRASRAAIRRSNIPAAQPISEAYEKARMTSIPASAVGPAGSTMGASAAGIPPPAKSGGKPAQGTPHPTSEGNQLRRPWTKEEGNTPKTPIKTCI